MSDFCSLEHILDEVSYDHKLAVTQWVMKHIVEHARDGGSYRYLIYDRLGFNLDAYLPLCSDGLEISNEFNLSNKEEIIEAIKLNNYYKLKPYFNLCDEEGCYIEASCGWPSESGYRSTCIKHMKKND